MTSHAQTPDKSGRLSEAAYHARDCLCPCHQSDAAHNSNVLCQRALLEPLEKERDEAKRIADTAKDYEQKAQRGLDEALVMLFERKGELQAATADLAEERLRTDALERTLAEAQEENTRLREQLGKMIGLAAGLHDDDPWFGDQRNAPELIAQATEVLEPRPPLRDEEKA